MAHYERIMKLRYEGITEDQYNELADELQYMGLTINGTGYDYEEDIAYGLQTEENTKTFHWIVDKNDDKIYSSPSKYLVEEVFDSFKLFYPDLKLVEESTTSVSTQYKKVSNACLFLDDSEYTCTDSNYDFGHDVTQRATLRNWYGDLDLRFTVDWQPQGTKHSKAEIEHHVVDIPLATQGRIQSLIESALDNRGHNYEPTDIDCQFVSYARNERQCSPDIISKVRNARFEEEE